MTAEKARELAKINREKIDQEKKQKLEKAESYIIENNIKEKIKEELFGKIDKTIFNIATEGYTSCTETLSTEEVNIILLKYYPKEYLEEYDIRRIISSHFEEILKELKQGFEDKGFVFNISSPMDTIYFHVYWNK